jgi:hypothetical protein
MSKITYDINTIITTENGVDLKTLGSILQQFTQDYLYIENNKLYSVNNLDEIKTGYKLSYYDGCFCHTDGFSKMYCFRKELSDHWNTQNKIQKEMENSVSTEGFKPTVKFNLSRRFIELSQNIPNLEQHNDKTEIMANSRINAKNAIVDVILYKRKKKEMNPEINQGSDAEIRRAVPIYVSPDVTPYLSRKSINSTENEEHTTEEHEERDERGNEEKFISDEEEFSWSETNNESDTNNESSISVEFEIPKLRKYDNSVSLYKLPTFLRDVIIECIQSKEDDLFCYQPFYYNGATIKIKYDSMTYKNRYISNVYQVYDINNNLNLDRLNPNLWDEYQNFESREKGFSNLPIALFTLNEHIYETNINDVTPVFNDLNREKDIIEKDLKDMFLNKPKMHLMKLEIMDNNVKLYVIYDIDNEDELDNFWSIEMPTGEMVLLYLIV